VKAVAHASGGRFEVVEVPEPAPGPDELVLRVRACGICGSDLKAGPVMPAGTVMGHEFCGEVVAAGRDVRAGWRDGDLAASMPLSACGRCRWCLNGEVAHCEGVDYMGLGGMPGGFAEYVRVAAAVTFPLPDEAGDAGALVEPMAVGLHTVGAAGLRPADSVLILGGGAVGAAVLVWARRLGAGRIVVSDPSPARRDAVMELEASAAHDPGAGAPAERFDVAFECVGGPGMTQAAVDSVATRGRVVVAGTCAGPDEIQPLTALMKEVDVRWAVYYTRQEFSVAAQLVASGRLDIGRLVTGRTSFDGFDTTFGGLARGELKGKYLLQPGPAAPLT
jgi:2-desacetyl-2-hydroxyethyl bacteriochlorophyllide A dehydrogenase